MSYLEDDKHFQVIEEGFNLSIMESISAIEQLNLFCNSLSNEDAKYICMKGLLRRSFHIRECLLKFYEIFHVEINEKWENQIPESYQSDLTAYFNSFLINLCGGLDNLASIIILENKLSSIDKNRITFFNPEIQNNFSDELKKSIAKHNEWLKHLKSFRNPIAHREPIYIVPYIEFSDNSKISTSPHYAISNLDGRLVPLHNQVICDARGFFEIINIGIKNILIDI